MFFSSKSRSDEDRSNVSFSKPSPVSAAAVDEKPVKADVLVAGSIALDLSCDYASQKPGDTAPHPHVSNPAAISQSVGGVGHNVALAAHRAGSEVSFCSLIGDDVYVWALHPRHRYL